MTSPKNEEEALRLPIAMEKIVAYHLSRGEYDDASAVATEAAKGADLPLRRIVTMLADAVKGIKPKRSQAGNPKMSRIKKRNEIALEFFQSLLFARDVVDKKVIDADEIAYQMIMTFQCKPEEVHSNNLRKLIHLTAVFVRRDVIGATEALSEDARRYLRKYNLHNKRARAFSEAARNVVLSNFGVTASTLRLKKTEANSKMRGNSKLVRIEGVKSGE